MANRRTTWLSPGWVCFLASWVITASAHAAPPPGYKLVFHDDFNVLSLRTGGPTPAGYVKGTGRWTPEAQQGLGYEWFVSPDSSRFSPFSVSHSILTIEAGPLPANEVSAFPAKTRGRPTHFGGALTTFNSFARRPPFYVEARMKLSAHPGAWPALWTLGLDRETGPASNQYAKQWENDIVETFGDVDAYFVSVHWNDKISGPYFTAPYRHRIFAVPAKGADLANRFNVYGSLVSKTDTVWFFNGQEVARQHNPPESDPDQPQFLILDLAFGFPWTPNAKYPETRASIQIDYIKVYAPP